MRGDESNERYWLKQKIIFKKIKIKIHLFAESFPIECGMHVVTNSCENCGKQYNGVAFTNRFISFCSHLKSIGNGWRTCMNILRRMDEYLKKYVEN